MKFLLNYEGAIELKLWLTFNSDFEISLTYCLFLTCVMFGYTFFSPVSIFSYDVYIL